MKNTIEEGLMDNILKKKVSVGRITQGESRKNIYNCDLHPERTFPHRC